MTSSKMENPLWKKLQNDPALLKQFNMQQNQMTNLLETGANSNNASDANNGMLQNVMTGGNGNNHNGADNSDDANDTGGGTSSNYQAMNSNNVNDFNYYQNASQSASPSVQKKNGSKQPNSNSKQQQQQQAQASYMPNFDQQNQQLQQLQQYINNQEKNQQHQQQQQQYNTQHSNISNGSQSSNGYAGYYEHPNASNNKRSSPAKRELGLVEKLVGSYGFVKCLERDGRLFFHYSSFQMDQQQTSNAEMGLKVGDVVEFEEIIHKRNGKPIATNITKFQQNNQDSKFSSVNQNQDFNMYQLNQLLSQNGQQSTGKQQADANSSDNFYNNPNQNNYNSIMNGLKMMNLQSSQAASSSVQNGAGAMNPAVMNLFNKENMYNNSNSANNQLNQLNMNSNLVNMFKSAAASQQSSDLMNDSLGNLANILNLNNMSMNNMEAKKIAASNGNEQMEGSIAIVAVKRAITSQYNGRNQNYVVPQLDGRITYQRSGETFYIPYSLSDVVPASSSSSPMPNFNQSPVALKIGDRVRFLIAQALGNDANVPAGTYYARRVEPITLSAADYNDYKPSQSMQPKQLYRGVITTLKESFGKIEREDLFKETFFHFHEYRGQNPNQELKLGLNVEFELQDRYGKEIACNIKMLPNGTVSFDELSQAVFIGRIVQPLTKVSNLIHNTNLNGINLNEVSAIGKLIYDNTSVNGNASNESLTELLFSDLDRVPNSGNYTLLEGDFVQFRIATDKRKKNYSNNAQMHRQPRAANVTLIEEHSLTDNSGNTGEYRERGVLVKLGTVRELVPNLDIPSQMEHFRYGAIKCVEQNELVYFSLDEVISYVRFAQENGSTKFKVKEVQLAVGDSLEFRVIKCQKDPIFKNGLQAIRVQQLNKNAVQFERISPEFYTGTIEREPITTGSMNFSDKNCGLIRFEYKNGSAAPASKTILFAPLSDESEKSWQSVGDKVQFNLSTDIKTKRQLAVNIKLLEPAKEQGFITMLKENYGFIELLSKNQRSSKGASAATMPRDIFFHFSSVQSSMNELDVGDEVEFKINRKTRGDQKICAEAVVKLKSGSIKPNNFSSTVYKGRVVQQLRSHNLTSNANTINFSQDQQQAAVDDVYYGKVQVNSSKKSENEAIYEFGLASLQDKKKCFQIGELVTFQLASFQDGIKRAYNLQSQQSQSQDRASRGNDLKRGKIDSIKGHCGFIEYAINANNDMKKVFFHISDLTEGYANVKSDPSCIQIGEEVEFTLMHNSRSGKYSAIKIKKLNSSKSANTNGGSQLHHSSSNGKDLNEQTEIAQPVAKRPDHLITKLKIGNVDDVSGKRLVLIRQPGKPDGKSFSRRIFERLPGTFEEIKKPEPVVTPTEQADTVVSESNEADVAAKSTDSNADQASTISIMNLIIANEPTEN